LERKVGDFAMAAAAVQVTLGKGGRLELIGIGLTNAGPTPIRARDAEAFLNGKQPDGPTIAEAAGIAARAASPTTDVRGSAEYKREMSRVLTGRALERAVQRAGGNNHG
jgi:carbon-monoxide dehydrogenase medium subunit